MVHLTLPVRDSIKACLKEDPHTEVIAVIDVFMAIVPNVSDKYILYRLKSYINHRVMMQRLANSYYAVCCSARGKD